VLEPYRIDEAELAAVAFLPRYSGRTLDAHRHDLRNLFQWAADHDLAVLEGTRANLEMYRSSMEQRGLAPSTYCIVVWKEGHVTEAHDGAGDRREKGQISTTVKRSSRPRKSSLLRVKRGRFAAREVAAIKRSTARGPWAFRPTATTAAYTRPYALDDSTSKGKGSKVASAR
jgi:hypothetical protein